MIFAILLLGTLGIGALFFSSDPVPRDEAKSEPAPSHNPIRHISEIPNASSPDDRLPMPESTLHTQEITKVEPAAADDGWVRQTLSETWIDGPEKLTGRHRVRVVMADFKYPRLRLEESVSIDPDTGAETVTLTVASVADHLLIGLRDGVESKDAAAAIRDMGYPIRHIEQDAFILAEIPTPTDARAQERAVLDLASLEKFIDHAEPDYLVFPCLTPNDPAYTQGKMWNLHNPGMTAGAVPNADIDAPGGWEIRHSAPNIIVAVTDTGIHYNHEDLRDNMWRHPVDNTYGFDAYDNDNDPMDVAGHGTHCAGIIGAKGNNGIGTSGVAWNVQLMALRFLGPDGGTTSDAIRVIDYARENGAHIINASWGGAGESRSLLRAIEACREAGIPIVTAAGNSSSNNDAIPQYPANFDSANIIAVAASTKMDTLSPLSSYGRTTVHLAAPGSAIWSTHVGSDSAYTYLNGTSMAAPHVTGALALALAQFAGEPMETVIDRLLVSVDPIPAMAGKTRTGGRLNLARLLSGGVAPPSPYKFNDDFDDAYHFEEQYGAWNGSNFGATREPDEDSFSLPDTGERSLWLAFETAHRGLVSLHITSDAPLERTIIFEGGAKGELIPIIEGAARRFETEEGAMLDVNVHEIQFMSKPGMQYRLLLDAPAGTNQRFWVYYNLGPPNDLFAAATQVIGERFTINGYNRGATREAFEVNHPHAGVGQGKSVWWKWTAPADLDFTISTAGSDFDTVLSVYTGDTPADLLEIASNDDRSPLDWTSQVNFSAIAGTTYHIAVDSFRSNSVGQIMLQGFRSDGFEIIRQPLSQQVDLGRRVVLEVSVLSGFPVTYQWFHNETAMPGRSSANLVFNAIRPDQLGEYHVEVSNNDSLLVSEIAVVSERVLAPQLTWTSGNQSVARDTPVTLSATFSGAAPMTFSWTKNRQPITGNTASIHVPGVQNSDAGTYRVTATNAAGSATAEINLTVVDSPWERWEWRRPGHLNAPVTDIKVLDGEVFAVLGTMLMRSPDGEDWSRSVFPQGFRGNTISKLGNRFICFGLDIHNQFRVAVSTDDAVTWTIQATIGYFPFGSQQHSRIMTFDGALIASTEFNEAFYRSTNGTEWTQLTGTSLYGNVVNLSGRGNLATDGQTLILASQTQDGDFRMPYWRSDDGIHWTEHHAAGNTGPFRARDVAYAMGKFQMFGQNSIYQSDDGFTWSFLPMQTDVFEHQSYFATNGTMLFDFERSSQTLRYFSVSASAQKLTVQPANAHTFTAAASFGDVVLYGTNQGWIGKASHPHDVIVPTESSTSLSTIRFDQGIFIARTSNQTYNNLPDWYSGDGIHWKQNHSLHVPDTGSKLFIAGSAYGKIFGFRQLEHAIYSGNNPFDLRRNLNDDIGLPPNISFIDQLPNGDAIGVVAPPNNLEVLYARSAGSADWTLVNRPSGFNNLRFTAIGDRWFSGVNYLSSKTFFTSSNGTHWESTGLEGINPHFINFDGKFWCVFNTNTIPRTVRVASSTNGTSWVNLATTGLPENIFHNQFLKRVVTFGGYLVLLGNDGNLYFSENGITWLRGPAPGHVVDIASGNGQLVAILNNGAIIQTGQPHPGGGAPRVSILSPQTLSAHLLGSRVTVEGTVDDPEDGTAHYECFLDDQLIASGTGNSFRVSAPVTDLAGHTVTVHAIDSHGLRSMDTVRIQTARPKYINSLAQPREGFVPSEIATVFDGVFYAADGRSLFRSVDGAAWHEVPFPDASSPIHSMASGNGALVIQLGNGSIMTTRDGINWSHFNPAANSNPLLAVSTVQGRIRFDAGIFLIGYRSQGSGLRTVMVSEDGLRWSLGGGGSGATLTWSAHSEDRTIIGADTHVNGIRRSRDGGFNWFSMAPFASANATNSHGIHAQGQFVVVCTGAVNKLFHSPDAITWEGHPLPAGVTQTPVLSNIGGLYFLGNAPEFFRVSTDAIEWHPMSHAVDHRKFAYTRGMLFAQAMAGGIVTSVDGRNWTPAGIGPSQVSQILANEDWVVLIEENGAVWRSPDGQQWENTLIGSPSVAADLRLGRHTAQMNDTLVTAGDGLLVWSDSNGVAWSNSTIDDNPPSLATTYQKLAASGDEFLVLVGHPLGPAGVARSVNGSTFTMVQGLPTKTWVDLKWNGNEWMLLATDGTILRSIDGGISWNALQTSGMQRGAAIDWFNGRWVIIGSELNSTISPYRPYTLESDDHLDMHGVIGFFNSSGSVNTLVAHNRMIIWISSDRTFISSNGTSWVRNSLDPNSHQSDIDHLFWTLDGFTALRGETWWSAGPSATEWVVTIPPFINITRFHNLGERVFLYAPGLISEIDSFDLALTLPPLADVTLGVGDELAVDVMISNLGASMPPGGTWRVTAWLAKNRFFGDRANTRIGTIDLTDPMPEPGASHFYAVAFTLPNEIPTGDNYIILSLSGPDGFFETNTANNTVISENAAVFIPEWEFIATANGNGQVNRDFAAMRYPHNAQVSLTATAGKGAVFTGWEGDGFSPNNQITILMDGPKSIQANFSNRATLQVFTRGAGVVKGLEDLGSYPLDATAAVVAEPGDGWEFSRWSGASSSTEPEVFVTMDATKMLTAHFILPIESWREMHFTPGQLADPEVSGDLMDPDGDGVPNWIEYLHGSDPLDSSSTGRTAITLEQGYLRCIYTRNIGASGGASIHSQAGRDLMDWNAPDKQERILSTENGIETVEIRLPMTEHEKGFIRFRYNPPVSGEP